FRGARLTLGLAPDEARAYMVRTDRWKFISYDKYDPQLFDLETDPKELHDLGQSEDHAAILIEMEDILNDWLRKRRNRTTISHEDIEKRTDTAKKRGIYFGVW
ncbi:MAG: DUF4976 domain-containing protein, partial [Alphaproteobacteria bacterium]